MCDNHNTIMTSHAQILSTEHENIHFHPEQFFIWVALGLLEKPERGRFTAQLYILKEASCLVESLLSGCQRGSCKI